MICWLYSGLLLRIAGAAVLSFLVVMLMGPRMIRLLIRKKVGDRPAFDHADLNQITRDKSNTPTMGGILIVTAVFVAILLFADVYDNLYVRMSLVALAWLGGLGAVDDWFKLRAAAGSGGRQGLRSWEKLLFQVGLAVLLAVFMYSYSSRAYSMDETGTLLNPSHSFYFPILGTSVHLSRFWFTVIAVVTMVGSSNAVNLTDGMDGLASGCMVILGGVFLILSWVVGVTEWARFFDITPVARSAEMTVVCSAIAGACVGFLWYNTSPAQVFMGDTGSLPLGGLLGFIAVVTRQELLLVIAGGVFVMEAGSVILQVGYFKTTKRRGRMEGKRLFRIAPIHHHFHLGGWAEQKVVVRFWLLGIIFAVLALATLKLHA